ncbi:uncharacterized protein LOC126626728 isoform X3 [Malus sylvestris]|uniref:uncharacterized protein LOC126626728 isoform X3 n=1 Tax=Malus sylvestris TaxID=3752 RepID=UPI0010A9CFB7|nr:uncharacterized protein LOC103424991 isoform X3 [Malus domestica]XP_050152083.1 uncharacterized protein LOC126626728 isoform X3 [Malus sylvestris]
MTLINLSSLSPWLSRLSHHPSPPLPIFPTTTFLFRNIQSTSINFSKLLRVKASLGETQNGSGLAEDSVSELLDAELLGRVSGTKDAQEALQLIAEMPDRNGGVVSVSDCCAIISAALKRNNRDLALSVFYEMRASFDQGVNEDGPLVERWKWSRPDVRVYTSLILGLAASLRVSDAMRMINNVCRVGVSPAEEVPFGKVVRCPSCMIAVAVAQPQHGIQLLLMPVNVQVVSCAKCCYQYELISGNIASIESEEISMDVPAWKRGLRFLNIMKQSIPAAVHSIVVQTPSGIARTNRFATETVDLPAQEGERVTIALAAPSSVYREVGPLKFSPKAPNFYPGEPICLTNHEDGRESKLLRAPLKDGGSLLTNPSILFPIVAVLASGNAASGVIDPTFPQFLPVAAVASLAVGVTLNTLVVPQLNRLPRRIVDTVAIKQQLLSQYDTLQSRIRGLKESAEKEVWMLARMCQLENKIVAVGEPSYRARRSKVKRVREGLENSLKGRIELIDSYARISSMIEIEVELDSDVLAAEAASNARWRIQVEANDEAERLLSSQPMPTEQV